MTESSSIPLTLFNSLTRKTEPFVPIHAGEARVYTCGPTVYNFQHIGNMRAYIFADTLGRVLSWKGFDLTHIVNITDVGHLTSDADTGDDKMEKAASESGRSARDIAKFYTDAYWRDIERLNIRQPAKWSIASDHVGAMIDFAKNIADKYCYELASGLYFDTATVPDYGRLARAATDDGEGRIDPVAGKRQQSDFAIWRKTPAGETRQMEWDSPWGKGAPGWHLECSVMSKIYLGDSCDIHTGGIDHREIHHPNEIAQNQAHSRSTDTDSRSADTGANIWMHNNFLVERGRKMAKSAGEFLTLQLLIDKGIHPLAYRLMCLQAHYRSELEFTFGNLLAALTRLKRLILTTGQLRSRGERPAERCTHPRLIELLAAFDAAVSDDLNTPKALTIVDDILDRRKIDRSERLAAMAQVDAVLGLELPALERTGLRLRPGDAVLEEAEVERQLDLRLAARSSRNFPVADAIRNDLTAGGIEIMDGDPLRWEWKIETQ